MNRSILFRHVARTEFDAAADWYEHRRRGLGAKFTVAVRRVLDRASTQPDFHPEVWRNVREALVRGFPYCIYYREEQEHLLVLAVFHTSRDPSIWRSRD